MSHLENPGAGPFSNACLLVATEPEALCLAADRGTGSVAGKALPETAALVAAQLVQSRERGQVTPVVFCTRTRGFASGVIGWAELTEIRPGESCEVHFRNVRLFEFPFGSLLSARPIETLHRWDNGKPVSASYRAMMCCRTPEWLTAAKSDSAASDDLQTVFPEVFGKPAPTAGESLQGEGCVVCGANAATAWHGFHAWRSAQTNTSTFSRWQGGFRTTRTSIAVSYKGTVNLAARVCANCENARRTLWWFYATSGGLMGLGALIGAWFAWRAGGGGRGFVLGAILALAGICLLVVAKHFATTASGSGEYLAAEGMARKLAKFGFRGTGPGHRHRASPPGGCHPPDCNDAPSFHIEQL